jgi:hypothetical protein
MSNSPEQRAFEREERAVDRELGILSILIASFGILVALIWLLIMYSLAVHWFPDAFGVDWPNPVDWIPPAWRRTFGL